MATSRSGKIFLAGEIQHLVKQALFRSFSVGENKIALITPKNKIGFVYRDDGTENVKFTWKDISLDGKYVFEFSNTPEFKEILNHTVLDKAEFDFKFPRKENAVYWRVLTKNQTSSISMFRISPAQRLDPPRIEPLVKTRIQEDSTVFGGTTDRTPTQLGQEFVEVFLPSIESASSYRVEVMRDYSGKNIMISKTLSSPIFRWDSPPTGEFYLRVSYSDEEGNRSPSSTTSRLVIEPKDKGPDASQQLNTPY